MKRADMYRKLVALLIFQGCFIFSEWVTVILYNYTVFVIAVEFNVSALLALLGKSSLFY